MNYRNILKDIEKNELKRVYLLFGRETYIKDTILNKVKEKYIDSSFETLNYSVIDGKNTNYEEIFNATETLPFMAEKKIVIVEDLPLFKNSKADIFNGEEELIEYIPKLSDTTCLIFISKEEKVDNRKKLVKNIKEIGDVIELNKLAEEDLNNWVLNKFNNSNKKISKNEIIYFLNVTSYLDKNSDKTLHDLENEIDKIVNYVKQKDDITKIDIDSCTSRSLENDIFKLVDFIGQKNTSSSLNMFNDMISSGEAVPRIIYMVIRQIRLIYMVKLMQEKGYSQKVIGQKINIRYSFIVQKLLNQAKNFSERELFKGLEMCKEVDEAIKPGKIDPKLGMEVLIVELSKK